LHALNDQDVRLLWDIRFDSAKSADAFAAAAADLLSSIAGTEQPAPLGQPVPTPDGRQLVLSRPAPDLVRLTNALP
jgi:hypothetical protein